MERSLLTFLERAAARYPDKRAYADLKTAYTFGEMLETARRIGSALAARVDTAKAPVAVYLEKSAHCVAAYFGALCCGAFYCPIDAEMPLERIRLIMGVLQPRAVITTAALAENARAAAPEAEILFFGDLAAADVNAAALAALQETVTENDPAYVLFTSGSTGVPKGVLLPHRVLIRYLEWLDQQFDLGPDDVFGNQAPLYFDISTHDIYGTAYFGACMEIIPPHLFSFPVKLVEYLNERRVTTFLWVPSAMSIVARLKTFRAVRPLYLRAIMFAGEVLPRKQLDYWVENLPDAVYANLYGPTETFVCTGYIRRGGEPEDEPLPIGKARELSGAGVLPRSDAHGGVLCAKPAPRRLSRPDLPDGRPRDKGRARRSALCVAQGLSDQAHGLPHRARRDRDGCQRRGRRGGVRLRLSLPPGANHAVL